MHRHHPTVVSTRDYYRLQAMMGIMIDQDTPIANLVRRKLRSAIVMPPTDLSPDIVAAGRCVRFTIDGRRTDVRALTWDSSVHNALFELPLLVPRGLALLGLAAGQSISYRTSTARTEFIEIDAVGSDDGALRQFGALRETVGELDQTAQVAAAANGHHQPI